MSNPIETGVRIRDLRAELRRLEQQNEQELSRIQPLSIADEHRMFAMQARADEVYRGAGRHAPSPEAHERPAAYERRLLDGLKVYSPTWSEANFSTIPEDAFKVAQEQVFADAAANAKRHGLQSRQLRPIETKTASGHTAIEYVGGENSWFGRQFERPARRAVFRSPEEYSAMTRDSQMAQIANVYRRPTVSSPRASF